MNDDGSEDSAESDSGDAKRADRDGFVWQSEASEDSQPPEGGGSGDAGESSDPSDEHPSDLAEGETRARIWDQIVEGGDENDASGTAAADRPNPPRVQRDALDSDDADGSRVWNEYLSEVTEGSEEQESSSDLADHDRRGAPGQPPEESSDGEPRQDDYYRRSASDASRVTPGEGQSERKSDTSRRFGWIDERQQSPEPTGLEDEPPTGSSPNEESTTDSANQDVSRSTIGTVGQFDVDTLGSRVLVLDSEEHESGNEVCARLFQATDSDRFDVVFVTFEQTAAERTAVFKHVPDGRRGSVAAFEVGVYGKSASPVVAPEATETANEVTIRRLSDPANVSKLGIMISQLVSEMEPAERSVVVCFHSVTALGSYVDTERLFRFLHILTGFLAAQDVRGHFHVDPSADSHQTVRTIAPLFDSVVHVSPGGQVEVE